MSFLLPHTLLLNVSFLYNDETCYPLDSDIGADRDTVLARKMARDRKGESGMPGTGSAEDVSLYRSELVAIHFGSKTRPAPAGKRGTEICLPHNFEVDSSGRTTMLGKPATPGVTRYDIN